MHCVLRSISEGTNGVKTHIYPHNNLGVGSVIIPIVIDEETEA